MIEQSSSRKRSSFVGKLAASLLSATVWEAPAFAESGDVDETFGVDGVALVTVAEGTSSANGMMVDDQGRLIVVGSVTVGPTTSFAVARFLPDGAPDTEFGAGGVRKLFGDAGTTSIARDVARQGNKIVVVGYSDVGAAGTTDFALVRLDENGDLDGSFSNDGMKLQHIKDTDTDAFGVAVQADGKIVIGGRAGAKFGAARFLANGALDTSFSSGGFADIDFGSTGHARDVVIQQDGKIILAGSVAGNSEVALTRLTSTGDFDVSFDGDGRQILRSLTKDVVNAVTLQSGKILVAGSTTVDGADAFMLLRLEANGDLDETFGDAGQQVATFDGNVSSAYAVTTQDGRILVVGEANFASTVKFAVARFDSKGQLDVTFSGDGMATAELESGSFRGRAAAVVSGQRLVVAGDFGVTPDSMALTRFFAGVCGDDTLDIGEECDDGNTAASDCCASNCLIEVSCAGPGTAEIHPLFHDVDPNLPTIVLTHGLESSDKDPALLWTGTGSQQAGSLIAGRLGDGVNILQFIWQDGFQAFPDGKPTAVAYKSARAATSNAGAILADELIDLLGPDYDQSIHFIGHSLGTVVNAYGARTFLDSVESVKTAQFTALDRPQHFAGVAGMDAADDLVFGYDEDFFAGVLPVCRNDLTLYVDNYYSHDGADRGLGDRATGPVYNKRLIAPDELDEKVLNDEGQRSNHVGVHQWYRWTINPTFPFPSENSVCGQEFPPVQGLDESLNPCDQGWAWSLGAQIGLFPEYDLCTDDPATELPFDLDNFQGSGCEMTGSGASLRIECEGEPGIATVAAADDDVFTLLGSGVGIVHLPEDASYLQFSYDFGSDGSLKGSVTVRLDGVEICIITVGRGRTPPLPLGGKTGDHQLSFQYYGSNPFQRSGSFFDFVVISTPVCGDECVGLGEECDPPGTFNDGRACGRTCAPTACGDTNDDGVVVTTDALFTLRAAVGVRICALSVCDADSSGVINTSDALRLLRRSVEFPAELSCPKFSGPPQQISELCRGRGGFTVRGKPSG
jgi:uncharacterized delta-60 repeat protein